MAITHEQTPAVWAYANNNTVSKAYGSAVSAGDLLWAFVYQLSGTASPTGVSDSVNGAWTPAGTLIRGDANNGNLYCQGYYFPNSGAGTPTVTANFDTSIHSVIIIGVIRGLAGGGALDQIIRASVNGPDGSGWTVGTSGALAQAVEAGVGLIMMTSAPGTPLWTADLTVDGFYYERVQRIVTSSAAAVTLGTTGAVGSGTTATGFAMLFKDAAAAGTPAGLATETDTALALAAKQIAATGLATEADTALALTTTAGLDFHSAAGLIFGDLAGALTSLAREASVSMVLRVYAVASPGSLVVESGTLTTDSNGRLARYTHASLVAATSYICTFIRASDGEVVSVKLTAT